MCKGFAPPVSAEDLKITLTRKLKLTATGMLPSVALIFSVMGTIVMGYAAPTEAAALGAFGKRLTIGCNIFSMMMVLKEAMIQTLKISSMMMLILTGGAMFSGVFLGLGGSDATDGLLSAMSMGPWAVVRFLPLHRVPGRFPSRQGSILLIFVPFFRQSLTSWASTRSGLGPFSS